MRRYSESVKVDVRRRMSPPHQECEVRISEELGIHVITPYKRRKTWWLRRETRKLQMQVLDRAWVPVGVASARAPSARCTGLMRVRI